MRKIKLNGGGYEAVILPEFGANCVSLKHVSSGAMLLRTPETEDEFIKTPFLYGMPLLFPPNRIEDGRFDFAGRTYSFSINEPERNVHLHGKLYQTPFGVECTKENEASFVYRATKENPYYDYDALSVQIIYSLDETGLKQTVTISNEGEELVPIGLGFHTAIPMPFLPNGKAEDVLLQGAVGAEYARDSERLLTAWDPLPDSEIHQGIKEGTFSPNGRAMSAQYLCGENRVMRIMDRLSGIAVVYELSEPYFSWLTWKPKESAFLCIEPQSWLVNAPNAPKPECAGLISVEPHQKAEFSARLFLSL